MDNEKLKEEILKHSRNAFETACTLRDNERIEVYLDGETVKTSDVLEENEEIVYTGNKKLCYQIYGHNLLEDEIKTWIDYARIIPEPNEETPLPEPTDIEKSIRELVEEIAKGKGVIQEQISSYEVFANLPMTLLGSIEQEIIEYWWSAKDQENAKQLALLQIQEVIN